MGGTPTPTGFVSTFRRQREFTIRGEADQIGQEGVETFSIPLSITSQVGLAAPVFAADPAMITVNDRSGDEHCTYTLCVYIHVYTIYTNNTCPGTLSI